MSQATAPQRPTALSVSVPAPQGGNAVEIVSAASGGNVSLGFDPSNASAVRDGNNLVFDTPEGRVQLSEFFAVGQNNPLPSLTLPNGDQVAAADFLAAMNPDMDMATAAGGGGNSGSGGTSYDDAVAALLAGIDRYGDQGTFWWNRGRNPLETWIPEGDEGGDRLSSLPGISFAGTLDFSAREAGVKGDDAGLPGTDANTSYAGQNVSGNVISSGMPLNISVVGTSAEQTSNGPNQVIGKYGTFTLNSNGEFVYLVDPAKDADKLTQGQTVTETFTVTAQAPNGTTSTTQVSITVTGTNDVPEIDANDSLEVLWTGAGATITNEKSGTIVANDIDAGGAEVNAGGLWQTIDITSTSAHPTSAKAGGGSGVFGLNASGGMMPADAKSLPKYIPIESPYGQLQVSQDGSGKPIYTFVMKDLSDLDAAGLLPSLKALGVDSAPIQQTFTVRTTDIHGSYSEDTITINIKGINDKPEISFKGTNGELKELGVWDSEAGNQLASGNDATVSGGTATSQDTRAIGQISGAMTLDFDDDGDTTTFAFNNTDIVVKLDGVPLAGVTTNAEGQILFNGVVVATFTIDANGGYAFTLAKDASGNANYEAFNFLNEGASLTFTVPVYATDNHGLSSDKVNLDFVIKGTNEQPTLAINGIADKEATYVVTEDAAKAEFGKLNVTDLDNDGQVGAAGKYTNHTFALSAAGVSGTANFAPDPSSTSTDYTAKYGTFTLNADGTYSYKPTYEGARAGESVTDTITVVVYDKHGAHDTVTLNFTIEGTNDPIVLGALPGATVKTTGVYDGDLSHKDYEGKTDVGAVGGLSGNVGQAADDGEYLLKVGANFTTSDKDVSDSVTGFAVNNAATCTLQDPNSLLAVGDIATTGFTVVPNGTGGFDVMLGDDRIGTLTFEVGVGGNKNAHSYEFTLNPSSPYVISLPEDTGVALTLKVSAVGTNSETSGEQNLVLNIRGTNDGPELMSADITDATTFTGADFALDGKGNVTATVSQADANAVVAGNSITITGDFNATDADKNETLAFSAFKSDEANPTDVAPKMSGDNMVVEGNGGTLYINVKTGEYTYEFNTANPDYIKAKDGDPFGDTFVVYVKDSNGVYSQKTLTFEVPPRNDAPSIIDVAIDMKENGVYNGNKALVPLVSGEAIGDGNYCLSAGGTFTVIDPDTADTGNHTFAYGAVSFVVGDTPVPLALVPVDSGVAGVTKYELRTDAGDKFGELTLNTATGEYSVTINDDGTNAKHPIDALNASQEGKLIVKVHVSDGVNTNMEGDLIVTIKGSNDQPTLEVTEALICDKSVGSVSGTFEGVDLDEGETATLVYTITAGAKQVSTLEGAHGTLVLNEDGTYTYTLTAATLKFLEGSKEVLEDTFTIRVQDVRGAWTEETVTIKTDGEDKFTISGITVKEMGEGYATDKLVGKIVPKDLDTADASATYTYELDTDALLAAGWTENSAGGYNHPKGYGVLTFDDAGNYTFDLNNEHPKIDMLDKGDTLADFAFKIPVTVVQHSVDGSGDHKDFTQSMEIPVNLQGTNDKPLIYTGEALPGLDGKLNASVLLCDLNGHDSSAKGTITATDVDDNFRLSDGTVGKTLAVDGELSYGGTGDKSEIVFCFNTGTPETPIWTQSIDTPFGSITINPETGAYTYFFNRAGYEADWLDDGELNSFFGGLTEGNRFDTIPVYARDDNDAFDVKEIVIDLNGLTKMDWGGGPGEDPGKDVVLDAVHEDNGADWSDGKGIHVSTGTEGGNAASVGGWGIHYFVDESGKLVQSTVVKNAAGEPVGTMFVDAMTGKVTFVADNTSEVVQSLQDGQEMQYSATVYYGVPGTSIGSAPNKTVSGTIIGSDDTPVVDNPDNHTFTMADYNPVTGTIFFHDPDTRDNLGLDDAVDADTLDNEKPVLSLVGGSESSGTYTITDTAKGYTFTLEQDGTYTFTVTDETKLPRGPYSFTVNVADPDWVKPVGWKDGDPTGSTTQIIKITAPNQVQPPVLAPIEVADDITNKAQSTIKGYIDIDGDAYTLVGGKVEGSSDTPAQIIEGEYGTLVLNPKDGTYTYYLNNNDTNVNELKAGESRFETFTITVSDGHGGTGTTNLVVTVNGTNDKPELFLNNSTLTAYAADPTAVTDGIIASVGNQVKDGDAYQAGEYVFTLNFTGDDTDVIVSPVTVNEASPTGSVDTPYGTLNFTYNTATGTFDYSFTVDPNAPATKALKAGQIETLDFTLTVQDMGGVKAGEGVNELYGSLESATRHITVNVHGTGDAITVITPTPHATITEQSFEDATNPEKGVRTGTVAVDNPEGAVLEYTFEGGSSYKTTDYGVWTINKATGEYTFVADAKAINTLAADQLANAEVTILVKTGGTTVASEIVQIPLVGANDAPVVDSFTGNLSLDEASATTVTGTIAASDVDKTDTVAYSVKDGGLGKYGTLTIGSDGKYTYTLDIADADTRALNTSPTGKETFTIVVSDGTTTVEKVVEVTVTGTNDAPVITVSAPSPVLESTTSAVVLGTYSATDVDSAALTFVAKYGDTTSTGGVVQGQYGSLILNIDGTYSYQIDANKAAILNDGQHATEKFTIQVSDGSLTDSQEITVNITGSATAPYVVAETTTTTFNNTTTATGTFSALGDTAALGAIPTSGAGSTMAITDPEGFYTGTLTHTGNGVFTYSISLTATGEAYYKALPSGTNGSDTLTLSLSKFGITDSIDLKVNYTGVNDNPTITSLTGVEDLTEDGLSTFTGKVNATDVDTGDVLSYAVTGTAAKYGTVNLNAATGEFTYTLNANAQTLPVGDHTDSFTIRVSDGKGGTVDQKVDVKIAGANDAPTITIATPSGPKAGVDLSKVAPVTGSVTLADIDAGDTLTVAIAGGSTMGNTITVQGLYGILTYDTVAKTYSYDLDPSASNYSSVESLAKGDTPLTENFNFTVTDPHSASDSHTLTFTITPDDHVIRMTSDEFGGTPEADRVFGTAGADIITGGAGDDILYGNAGADIIKGGVGADTLYGGDGDDYLDGGVDADLLYGGKGSDQLTGGAGADTFAWTTDDLDGSKDTITDFTLAQDKIFFEGLFATGTVDDSQAELDKITELLVNSQINIQATADSATITYGTQTVEVHFETPNALTDDDDKAALLAQILTTSLGG